MRKCEGADLHDNATVLTVQRVHTQSFAQFINKHLKTRSALSNMSNRQANDMKTNNYKNITVTNTLQREEDVSMGVHLFMQHATRVVPVRVSLRLAIRPASYNRPVHNASE